MTASLTARMTPALVALLGCLLFSPTALGADPANPGTDRAEGPPSAPAAVEFDVKGNRALTKGNILAELQFWLDDLRESPEDAAALVDLAHALEGVYRHIGHLEVEVQATVRRRRSGAWRVTLRVREGALHRIGKVAINGNVAFPDKQLRGAFPWPRTGLLDTGHVAYTDGALRSGVDGVKLIYRLEGYQDVVVSANVTQRMEPDEDDERITDVSVLVTEGERHTVGEVRVQQLNPDPASPVPDAEILKIAAVKIEDPYNQRLLIESRNRVFRALRNRGFYEAEVKLDARVSASDRTEWVLEFNVETGPVFWIDRFEIEGNRETNESWIRRHFPVDVGRLYESDLLQDGRRALLRTGLFRQVSVESRASEDDPQRIIVSVVVLEKDTVRFATKVGFGSYELGRFGVEVLHRNLFGRGIQGRARGKVSFRGEEAELSLRYPLLLRKNLAVQVSSLYRRFEEVSFDRQEVIGTVKLEYTPSRRYTVAIGYEVRDEKVQNPDPGLSAELREDSRSGLLFLEGRREARDSLLDATQGSVVETRFEYAAPGLGSELEFLRITGRFTQHFSLRPGWVFVASARAGTTIPLQSDVIPVGERFFLGGSRSVRSFDEDELGPRDASNNPIGGEAYVLGNLELRFPLWRSLAGAAFIDTGSVVADHNDIGRREYRYAAGGGLIWKTPIGPLRVDAAAPLNRHDNEDSWAVHFLLGHPF